MRGGVILSPHTRKISFLAKARYSKHQFVQCYIGNRRGSGKERGRTKEGEMEKVQGRGDKRMEIRGEKV